MHVKQPLFICSSTQNPRCTLTHTPLNSKVFTITNLHLITSYNYSETITVFPPSFKGNTSLAFNVLFGSCG